MNSEGSKDVLQTEEPAAAVVAESESGVETDNKMCSSPAKRMYISLPKKYMADLATHYELGHGLIIKQLNPYINEGYLQAYFRDWGTVTACKIMKIDKLEGSKVMGYVRFSSEDEADQADWAGPHYIGGTEVEIRRVVSPKNDSDDEMTAPSATIPRPTRSMGLGYILEDAQWLDNMN